MDRAAQVLQITLKSWRNPGNPTVQSVVLATRDYMKYDPKYKFVSVSNLDKINSFLQNREEEFSEKRLNNVISNAYRDKEEHIIEVNFVLTGNRLVVTIRDDGRPFNPFGLEPPAINLTVGESQVGGLGIHLVREMMDNVSYLRKANQNIVTLTKNFEKNSSQQGLA